MGTLTVRAGSFALQRLMWLRANLLGISLTLVLGVLIPLLVNFWMVSSPFTVLMVLRFIVVGVVLLAAFHFVSTDAPWYVRAVMSVILGQAILNYGFSNMVVGAGGAKVTVAELSVFLGLLFLLPKTIHVLKKIPAFWVCVVAMAVPIAVHLYGDMQRHGMSAVRDILSVVDLIYFMGGLAVTVYGLSQGKWVSWRNRLLTLWIVMGVVYGLLSPISPYIRALSPGFQSYQQTVPVLGHMLTAAFNSAVAVAAWFALPHLFPQRAWLKYPFVVLLMLNALIMVAVSQSRNYYAIFLGLPLVLAYFGYRKAFVSTMVGVVLLVAGLGVVEVFGIKIPGRINEVTLSAMIDRAMTLSGKHGDEAGAHGVNQRLDWWMSSLDKWSASPETILFGVGYGQALTNFSSPGGDYGEGVAVREPHNSAVSSLSRGGLVYFCLWAYIVLIPFFAAARGAKRAPVSESDNGHYRGVATWSVILMGMYLLTSLSEPIFETPSIASMYYFVAGMALVEFMVVTGKLTVPLQPLAQRRRV